MSVPKYCQTSIDGGILEAFSGFFKSVNEMWGTYGDAQKLRLWKEGGFPAIPVTSEGWSQLIQIRSLISNEAFDVKTGKYGKFPSIYIWHSLTI
jgi:hypothetical protein